MTTISQLLRDSFSVSQQPPIWEPPSHYFMILATLSVSQILHLMISSDRFLKLRSESAVCTCVDHWAWPLAVPPLAGDNREDWAGH